MPNQNPEQLARDQVDKQLIAGGWLIQNKNQINLNAATGIAIREYQTDIGPADYVLFVNKQAVAIIEAKRAEEGIHLSMHEEAVFNNPELRNFIVDVRKKYDQVIDGINIDTITNIGWVKDQEAAAALTISNFTAWIQAHKDEITALQVFYGQPYRRRELTYKMIRNLYEKIITEQPLLSPLHVWRAYQTDVTLSKPALSGVEGSKGELSKSGNILVSPRNELIALVSLIRKVTGIDEHLAPYDKTVDKNFQDWVFKKQAGNIKFTSAQMQWLRMIKDYVASSFHVDKEDFELDPFNKQGGLGRFYQLFKDDYEKILEELNEALAA